jgi:hypothetical protein
VGARNTADRFFSDPIVTSHNEVTEPMLQRAQDEWLAAQKVVQDPEQARLAQNLLHERYTWLTYVALAYRFGLQRRQSMQTTTTATTTTETATAPSKTDRANCTPLMAFYHACRSRAQRVPAEPLKACKQVCRMHDGVVGDLVPCSPASRYFECGICLRPRNSNSKSTPAAQMRMVDCVKETSFTAQTLRELMTARPHTQRQ